MFKDLLTEKNISIYALSKKSGVSYTALNELYRGERTVEQCTGKTLKSIADSVSISLDELYAISMKREEIPSSLKKCFWDTKFEELDLEKNKIYIISRLLDKGGYDGLRYLHGTYTYEDFKSVGINSRQLTPKVANFLSNVYHIKKEDMRFYKNSIDWR